MITTETARQELEAAIAAFADVEALASKASTVDVGIAWAAARARIEAATAQLGRAEYDERQRAELAAARAEAEKTHAKSAAERATALEDAEARIVAALTAAQEALTDAFAGVEEYNVTLAQYVGEMAAQGLAPILDGHQVGADPQARVAVLDGRSWREVDGNVVVAQLTERLRLARQRPAEYEVLARRLSKGHMANQVAADVLAAVPRPDLVERERPWSGAFMPDWEPPRPLFASEWARQEAEKRRAEAVEMRPLRWKVGPDGERLPIGHPAYRSYE